MRPEVGRNCRVNAAFILYSDSDVNPPFLRLHPNGICIQMLHLESSAM